MMVFPVVVKIGHIPKWITEKLNNALQNHHSLRPFLFIIHSFHPGFHQSLDSRDGGWPKAAANIQTVSSFPSNTNHNRIRRRRGWKTFHPILASISTTPSSDDASFSLSRSPHPIQIQPSLTQRINHIVIAIVLPSVARWLDFAFPMTGCAVSEDRDFESAVCSASTFAFEW
ncbi:hypothetical protein PM082_004601 [Marasmius tenuissimus]|nr:hypothetical protein PM082_004601 [Marasmius tenuissimus]